MSDELEELTGPVPGPRTLELSRLLRERESHNVTYLSPEFPVFWESADGATVTDVDGNRYLDFHRAFGVANVGHSNPAVASAIADQATRLMHGMGDVHPTEARAKLLERLPRILPPGLTKTFLATTGAEAVEAALKTAVVATGKPHFASFTRRVPRTVARCALGMRSRAIPRTVRCGDRRQHAISRVSAQQRRRTRPNRRSIGRARRSPHETTSRR